MASTPKLVVGSEVFDHAAVAAQIESLAQPQAGADLAGTLALVHEALADKAPHITPARKEVYFFTDLQARTWGGLAKTAQAADAKKQSDIAAAVASIAERASLVVVDLGQSNASNLAVTNLSASAAVVTAGRDIGLNAVRPQFRSGTSPKMPRRNARRRRGGGRANGRRCGRRRMRRVHFVHRFPSAGAHTVTIRTSGDRLDLDNSRSLVVPVRSEIRVLCVAGREGAAKYLANALNPNPAGDSPIRPIVIAEGDLADATACRF